MRILSGIQPYEDKILLADIMIEALRPVRERAAELRRHPAELRRVLDEGREAAGAIARETMGAVRSAVGLWQASTRIPTA